MQDENDALSGLVPDAYAQAVQSQQRQALLDALAGSGSTQTDTGTMDASDAQDPGSAAPSPNDALGAAPDPGMTNLVDTGDDYTPRQVANFSSQGGGSGGGGGSAPPAADMSCQSTQSGKAAQALMANLGNTAFSGPMHAAGVDVLQKVQADAANNAGDRAILDDVAQLARNKGLDDQHGMLSNGIKALAAKYGINLSGTQSSSDVMRQLLGGMASSSLAHGDNTMANVLSNSFSAKPLDSGAVASLLPMLRSQLDLKEARANVATNFSMAHPKNLSGLPALMSSFNQIADPATVSFGRRMAQVSGTPQHDQMLNDLMQRHPNNWCDYTNRVRTMDEMGAFTHAGY